MVRILYLGSDAKGSTSLHRARALQRLGHDVAIKNPYKRFHKSVRSRLWGFLNYRSGYRFLQPKVKSWVKKIIHRTGEQEIIWIDGGELFGSGALKILTQLDCPVILYNVDDPTGERDHRRFDSLLHALPDYDLVVVVRGETERECEELGASNVLRVYRSYDEVAHKPFTNFSEIPEEFKSQVAFIGTWMWDEGRGRFMFELAKAGVPISIWGGRWEKSSYWPELKPYYRGGSLSGRDYAAALQGAKICIGLLSKGNRDQHTQRSLEIPYAGGLLCAQRTSEHQQLYKEDEEAVFWDDAEECAQKCNELLNDDQRCEQIRRAGMRRVREIEVGNEDICAKILEEVRRLKTDEVVKA